MIVAALAGAAAVAAGWYYHSRGSGAASSQAGSAPAVSSSETVAVETVLLAKGGILRTSSQIGSVHPFEDADLFAKISGYLAKLSVDYGDHVKQGQLLAEIDDPEIVKEADKAAADVLQAKAAVEQMEAFIESAKSDRDAEATSVEQAVAEVDRFVSMRIYQAKKLARYKELVQSKAIPQEIADEEIENYESARAAEVSSQKAVLNAKAQLAAARARIKKAEADAAEARANVAVATAKLARANVMVGYTKITSPYNGVITKRNYFRGAFIRSAIEGGTVPLLTVARTDKVRVITQVPDSDVPWTDVGDDVEVTLDALGNEVLRGKVSRFSETEDPSSRTMYTEIDLPNPNDRIRPGMYGIAKILLDTAIKNATLPARCLLGASKGNTADLYVIRDGKAKKVQVTIGANDGIRVEILSGISPKDDVILHPGAVTEGTPVTSARATPGTGNIH